MVFHDVSQNRRAEMAQIELSAIVTSSDDAIFSVTLDGMILTWNPAAERIFGYAEQEIHGKSFPLLIAADRRDEIQGSLNQIRRGERVDRFETIGLCKDGSTQPASVRLTPLLDPAGHSKAATVILRDRVPSGALVGAAGASAIS
jgi:PAS domain S-box-containing protein